MDSYFSLSIISYLDTDGPSQFDELSINSSLTVLYKKIMFQIGRPKKEFNIIHFKTLSSFYCSWYFKTYKYEWG